MISQDMKKCYWIQLNFSSLWWKKIRKSKSTFFPDRLLWSPSFSDGPEGHGFYDYYYYYCCFGFCSSLTIQQPSSNFLHFLPFSSIDGKWGWVCFHGFFPPSAASLAEKMLWTYIQLKSTKDYSLVIPPQKLAVSIY